MYSPRLIIELDKISGRCICCDLALAGVSQEMEERKGGTAVWLLKFNPPTQHLRNAQSPRGTAGSGKPGFGPQNKDETPFPLEGFQGTCQGPSRDFSGTGPTGRSWQAGGPTHTVEKTSSFLCAPLLACILICSGQTIGRGQSLFSGHGSLSSAPWPSARPFFAHSDLTIGMANNTVPWDFR
ncbi:hypothetical protein ASPNIDRAFT_44987 [Aspergillus niger ATCC 1015]|uniref:Uncharacterized protein n=1 Tax=Aspergillus niger (strain ATCC 1015 / CBS 113.46 / FGSC A1144 / LSHB Ac4 / NCTC 3858a / NRRL 328 / USDA 3528.7) TaxID=380704 RepID=G3Y440_ASPNA|nr:hypothetical protein ASPNIDRAFT_44987 [Aspergillus niger ATCC 1015]